VAIIFVSCQKIKNHLCQQIKTIELRNLQIEDYKELKNQWWNPIQKCG
jgi:FtsZ-binding cell division protein ZapB